MDNKDMQVLQKIYERISSVLEYCKDCSSLSDFEEDSMRVDASIFNLMQIGELAKTSLTDDFKANIKTIPWKQIYGMRNRIVHGYDDVDMNIVWDTIKTDLPELKDEIKKYLR